eukprot:Sro2149_g316650.1 Similarities with uniprot P08640 Saccharomyces cerevisiae YIR019c STA1 (144) ;mRNA; r:13962-14393
MFGEPTSPTSVRFSEVGVSRWGWYQRIPQFLGEGSYEFTVWAGAGQYNEKGEGTLMGTATVLVSDCGVSSSSDTIWKISNDEYCINEDTNQRHVHVGTSLPRRLSAPGQYDSGCCVVGSECFIVVHGVTEWHETGCWKCDLAA